MNAQVQKIRACAVQAAWSLPGEAPDPSGRETNFPSPAIAGQDLAAVRAFSEVLDSVLDQLKGVVVPATWPTGGACF